MSFDARTAKLLPAGRHITFSNYPGLRLVSSQSSRTWTYRYKNPIDGKMKQIAIGHWPSMSFPAAVVEWEKLRHNRDKIEKKKPVVPTKEVYTVKQLCDDYVTGHIERHRVAVNAKAVASLLNRSLKPIEALPVETLTRQMAFDLISSVAQSYPHKAANLRQELGAAWDFAMDAGRLPDNTVNWWRLVLKGRIKSKGKLRKGVHQGVAKRVLSDEELRVLMPFAEFSECIRDVLRLYLYTACRGAEIVSILGNEVTNESSGWVWTIPKNKTKNARHANAIDHRVPLVGKALSIVLDRKTQYGDGYLFPAKDGKRHVAQLSVSTRVFELNRDKRLPVYDWSPHDLRRTSRTILAKIECPDSVAESILGHVIPGVMGVYNRYHYDEEKRVWLIKLSDYLEELVMR